MRRAVVTGGAGFIGSHVVDQLLEADFHVLALDSVGRASNLERAMKSSGFEYVQGSVNDLPFLGKLFCDVEYVFHHAAVPFTVSDSENGADYFRVNQSAILNVLQAAKDKNVKKVILASSSAVYGHEPTLPKREDSVPDPSSPYAISKFVAELYCLIYQRSFNLKTVCLRYFNVYGPRQSPDSQLASVIPRFVRRVTAGLPPIIFGDGNQTRDFVYVRDVAAANLLAAESDASGVYNIGSGKATTLNEAAQTVLALTGRADLGIIYEPEREGEIKHSVANISKASSFGYCPSFALEQGLKETIESR